jgi:hypothetical protein
MMAIIDTIMVILFVLFIAFLVIGFNRTQYEKQVDKLKKMEEEKTNENDR